MLDFILLEGGGSAGGGMGQLILLGAIVLVFYLFMIRPQQKKQKQQKQFRENVKKGDKVVTIGGIHGKIVDIEDNMIYLDVDRGTRLTLDKSSISMEMSQQHYPKEGENEKNSSK